MLKRTKALMGSMAVAAAVLAAPVSSVADTYWQCVPFARLISGIQIYGDAWTWWKQAVGRYDTGRQPQTGAVLCFKPNGRMKLGHVAVVSQVLTDRVIQITHANWSRIGGTRGQVERDVTAVDVSAEGDWSQVKVYYDPIRDLGSTTYPTHGFIYQDAGAKRGAASGLQVASNTAITVAQQAASQVASAVRPGAGPLSMLSQAADSTDRIAALIAAATTPDGGASRD